MPVALVTGANRGIGLEFCRQLIAGGYEVIAVCRRPSADLKGLELRTEEGVDVADVKSLAQLAQNLKGKQIDLLINNAGIMERSTLSDPDFDSISRQFEVNSVGPLKTTTALLPLLASDAKVAIVTSRMGSIADNTSGGSYGYRMSKAAVNMAGVSLAHDLKDKGIAVAILHPGYVRTDMTGHSGQLDPSESVQGMLERIKSLNLANSGTFWHSNGQQLPW